MRIYLRLYIYNSMQQRVKFLLHIVFSLSSIRTERLFRSNIDVNEEAMAHFGPKIILSACPQDLDALKQYFHKGVCLSRRNPEIRGKEGGEGLQYRCFFFVRSRLIASERLRPSDINPRRSIC